MENRTRDTQEMVTKLDTLFKECPNDFFFLKGYIHCVLQKQETKQEDKSSSKSKKLHKQTA